MTTTSRRGKAAISGESHRERLRHSRAVTWVTGQDLRLKQGILEPVSFMKGARSAMVWKATMLEYSSWVVQ